MSGAKWTIEVDDSQFRDLLGRLAEYGEAPLQETLGDIGAAMQISTRDRARQEISPDGVPWVALSDDYKDYKDRKRLGVPKLKFDFHMLGDLFSYQLGDSFVDLGTSAPYGAIHQAGGTANMAPGPAGIPARPWLGLSSDDEAAIQEISAEHLQAALSP